VTHCDLSEYILAPLFTGLTRDEAPHLRLQIKSFDDGDYEAQLGTGRLDVVVGSIAGSLPMMPLGRAASPVSAIETDR
jgi:hypothetical protein